MDSAQLEKSIRSHLHAHLGPALTALRRKTGKLQSEIVAATGMSASQVSRYENGRDLPNLVTLMKYLTAVDADLRDLADLVIKGDESPVILSVPNIVMTDGEEVPDAVIGKAFKDLVKAALLPNTDESTARTPQEPHDD